MSLNITVPKHIKDKKAAADDVLISQIANLTINDVATFVADNTKSKTESDAFLVAILRQLIAKDIF